MEFNFSGARIITSEVEDGSMDKENISQNLPKFIEKYYLGDVAYCEQVHGMQIEIISKSGFYKSADGLVTGERMGLIIKSADCIPLLFRSKEGILGAVHVGRRSLLGGIITKSLKEVFEKLSLSPTNINFFLAPHIRTNNYEVGEDLIQEISACGYSPFIKESHFDLTGALINDLVKIGVKEENIVDSGIDTFSDKRFFSYRRGDKNKLFASVISWPKDK